ncbi:serine/threonine-protein kinase pkn2-like [Penaeus japonicus]|uniref:serine/threonine-protein kinase pkn2-like n=1 Tax=Penaeus japonicus TaxID=27405 RepID=UPI001C717984|nr:serine/threonine-protein kinase pkn2-like [Penaeus japonicus]
MAFDADFLRRMESLGSQKHDFQVPVLSSEQFHAHLGTAAPERLGQGNSGTAFLNGQKDLVMKYADNLAAFRSFILEAKVMSLFSKYHGFQRLVGVCPEKTCLVTRYAGQTLKAYGVPGSLKAEQRISVARQVCKILQNLHLNDFAHNDIKPANICIRMSAGRPQVTLIDFGLTLVAGMLPRLATKWHERLFHAPEICGSEKPGPCGGLSDVYSVGKLLLYLFEEPQMPPLLQGWLSKSQAVSPSERSALDLLVEALEQELILRTGRSF